MSEIDSVNDSKPAAADAGKRKTKKSKAAKKSRSREARHKPKADRANKKADVIALMKRAKSATLAEMEATGWRPRTARGFVSVLCSKGGGMIELSKNSAISPAQRRGRTEVQDREITSGSSASKRRLGPTRQRRRSCFCALGPCE
jgi:hypothetical protein